MRQIVVATLIAVTSATTASADKPNAWQTKALKVIKAEKTVLDAKWRMPEANVLWVSMTPDGSRRDGIAQFLCLEFNGAGAPEGDLKTVFIYDPANFQSGGKDMGMAACR